MLLCIKDLTPGKSHSLVCPGFLTVFSDKITDGSWFGDKSQAKMYVIFATYKEI